MEKLSLEIPFHQIGGEISYDVREKEKDLVESRNTFPPNRWRNRWYTKRAGRALYKKSRNTFPPNRWRNVLLDNYSVVYLPTSRNTFPPNRWRNINKGV